ncbi:PGR3, partial [Symbiodinium necroappetens]
ARTYSPLIRLAGRAHPVLAHALLGEMRSAAVEPNGHSYLAVFDVYKAARDVEGAKRAWQDMRTAGVQPVYPAVSTIMSTVAKTGDISAAEALLQEARDLGLNATTVSYNCILDACHIAGDADAAFRILAEMRAAGFVPDVISYNCALGSLATAGRPAADRARLLEEMRRDGVSQNSLFLERHVCYALGMQLDQSKVSGAEELRAQFQELPAEARREALEAIRDSTESTKLVRALRSILESLEESQDESVQSNQQAQKTESGDWVKVLAKDEAGSQIEYFWDRISGKTQWQHPGANFRRRKATALPLCLFGLWEPPVGGLCKAQGGADRRARGCARRDRRPALGGLPAVPGVDGAGRQPDLTRDPKACSVMIARQESRPAAHLWQVDWQVLAKELQPSEDFATKLRVAALQLARGSKLEESLATSLWREMNRLPHIWSSPLPRVTGLGRDSCSLSGLEQLRQCVKEYAQLAAPRKTGTSGDHGGAVCAGSLLMDAGDGRPDAQEDEGEPGRPVSPSLKQETCFVFDWDDTILPTSWLERIHALAGGPLRPEVQRQLASLCSAVTQTLQIASTLGNIVIITNSAPGWVDQSCQIFMPQILQQIRSYPIYAKPMHAPLTFKITTFRRECKKFSNLISIGDGDAERAASLRLQAPSERRGPLGEESRQRVKSVKLVELPTCQQLIVQHEMLQVRLPDVTAFHGSLDLKSRFPTGSPQSKLMESDVAEEATASCEIQVHKDDEDCQEHCLPTWWDRHCQLQHTYGSSTLSVRVKALGLRASDVQSLLLGMSSFCARCVDPTVELVLELDASENDLSDEAGAILVSGLQDFGKRRQGHVRLRVLKLHKNQVGDATCQKIASLVWHQKQAVEDVPGLAMPADHGRTWQLRRQQQPGQATMQQGQEEQHQDGGGEAAAPATVTVGPDEADPPNEPWLEHYHSCAKERDAGEDEHRGMVRVGWLGPVERRSRASHYTQPCSLGFLVGYKNDRAESGPRKSVQLRASTAKNETEVGNSSLAGRAWVYAEELDVDIQASPGIDYYIRWVQTSGRALQERAPTARAKREWCCDSTRTDARPGWRSKWPKHSLHMTEEGHFDEGESEDDLAERGESDDELVEEGIAEAAHTAYMFQAAKAKYWEAVKGVCETETTGDGGSLRMETGMTGHPVLSVSQYAAELIHELEDNDVPVELRQQNAPPREEGQGPATHQETEDDGNAGVLQDPAPRPLQLNRRARPTRHSELLPGDGLNFTGAKAISFKGAPKHVLADLDSAFKDQFLETPTGAALPGSTAWLKDMAPSNAIWDKLVLERHIIASEVGEAAAAVSDAKNQLRNCNRRGDKCSAGAKLSAWARVEAVLRAGRPRLLLPPPPAWSARCFG